MTIDQIIRPCLHDHACYSPATGIDYLHFRFLKQEETTWIAPELKAVYKEIGSLVCLEIKGELHYSDAFELVQEGEELWLIFQFIGKSIVNNSRLHHLTSATYQGVARYESNIILQLDRGKTWLTLVRISGSILLELKNEYLNIGKLLALDEGFHTNQKPLTIGYKEKRIFDKIEQLKNTSYSFPIKLAYHINELFDLFNQELEAIQSTGSKEVSLYYQALDYIKNHYLKDRIPRKEIADHLCVHERTLTRAFEQKKVTISETIQMFRLVKAREWIRKEEKTIEEIANRLHFGDLEHFETAYYRLHKVYPKDDSRR